MNPAVIRWTRSFLTSREQCVKIGSSASSWKHVNGGLPQGTKLGPLLFAVLINPLLNDWHARIKFVDDATAVEIVPRCSPSLMPTLVLVSEMSQFASNRGMKLNGKKCKEILISFLQYRLPYDSPIYIDGKQVESVSSFKLLGVMLNDDLSSADHVDYAVKKANSRLYALRLLKKAGLNVKILFPYTLPPLGHVLSTPHLCGLHSQRISQIPSNQSRKEHCGLFFLSYHIMMP